ncbi:MAG: ATPase domain-containing protein [Candidatus Bathyarchaeia archaeon]|nr:hypothetical protein [Candidatus Bathyarchaeota archaeon]
MDLKMERRELLGKLISSQVHVELLTAFHSNPSLMESLEGLAAMIGRSREEVEGALEELKRLGLIEEHRYYKLNVGRDRELQAMLVEPYGGLDEAVAAEPRETFKSGVEVVDRLLPDGIPLPSSILILSDPGAGGEVLGFQLAGEALRNGRRLLYLAVDRSPRDVKRFMRQLGYDVDLHHRDRRLIFLDCYSPQIGVESSEEYSESPFNFPNLAMTLAGIIRDLGVKPGELVVILHSLTSILSGSEFRPALEFYRNISGKLNSLGAATFTHLNRMAFPAAVIAAVEDVADGVMELKTEEAPEGIRYHMRIPKMILTRHETRWRPYRIDVEKGVIP